MKTLLLILTLAAAVSAQTTDTFTQAENDTLGILLAIELEATRCAAMGAATEKCRTADKELSALYLQVSKSPKLIRYLTAQAVNRYQKLESGVKSAPQASQIADQQNAKLIPLLVIQNQRIIELLEAILKKPR